MLEQSNNITVETTYAPYGVSDHLRLGHNVYCVDRFYGTVYHLNKIDVDLFFTIIGLAEDDKYNERFDFYVRSTEEEEEGENG